MCGYKVSIQAKQLYYTLNAWRNIYSRDNPSHKRIVLPNDMVLHPTPRDAIDNMIYTHSSISKYFIIFC